ncbi:PAS domain S-box protein [Cellulomonas aerilata]|uniref:PAS domain S-box protein n=1 Tax=Cellulomonas aerilata TaxID=515326 RepID=UPI00164993E9|nr:PAS domain S-box protein [Cellulomonas aerilata]
MERVDEGRAPGTSRSGPDARSAGAPRRTVTLAPDPSSPAHARDLLRQVLAGAGRLECLDAAELACTELVTNAVLHAHTTIDVTVEVGDVVRVEVRDRNPTLPSRRHYDPHATTGRGLALVAALTDEHGVTDAGTAGKTMWFTVGVDHDHRTDDELTSVWDAAEWDADLPTRRQAPAPGPVRTREVQLLGLPSGLWLAARQHHDALLRELALYAAWHDELAVDVVATDRARSTLSGAVVAAVERRRRTQAAEPPDGTTQGPWENAPVDLTLDIPLEAGGDFAAMQDTLDAAEHLARTGHLLARPGLAEVVAVRDWACEQVVAQLAGVQPAAWPGADQERFTREVHPRQGDDLEAFDLLTVRCSSACVAAGDDSNRIVAVSEPLARLVGCAPEELVGRRIVVLVPPRFREAHVAGFTRHLSTGEVHVLGVPVTVPVLRADGSEVLCRLLIERSTATGGRSMYVASIEPVDEVAGASDRRAV